MVHKVNLVRNRFKANGLPDYIMEQTNARKLGAIITRMPLPCYVAINDIGGEKYYTVQVVKGDFAKLLNNMHHNKEVTAELGLDRITVWLGLI